jgi:hypothetical protein
MAARGRGRVQQAATALLRRSRFCSTADLREIVYGDRCSRGNYRDLRRVLDGLAVRVGRERGEARPLLWRRV